MAPSFTVGAIAVIERADGSVLLVAPGLPHALGPPRWAAASGGESPADGVRREVDEEVGLAIELIGEPAVVVDPGPQRVDLVFRARPVSEEAADEVRPCSPEIDRVGWHRRDALPELQVETAQALVTLARSSPFAPGAPPEPRVSPTPTAGDLTAANVGSALTPWSARRSRSRPHR